MMYVTTTEEARSLISEPGYSRFVQEYGLDPEKNPGEEVAIDRIDLLRYNTMGEQGND